MVPALASLAAIAQLYLRLLIGNLAGAGHKPGRIWAGPKQELGRSWAGAGQGLGCSWEGVAEKSSWWSTEVGQEGAGMELGCS